MPPVQAVNRRQRWTSGEVDFAAASTSVTIQAKKAGATTDNNLAVTFLVVTKLVAICYTSAAQAVTIKSGTTNVVVATLAPSSGVGNRVEVTFEDGKPLPANEDLIATATAGAAWKIYAEGYYDGFAPR